MSAQANGKEIAVTDRFEPRDARYGDRVRESFARQALMRSALERILAAPGLSPNTYEMVAKSLGRAS